jgi:mRNA-degrading endonuclease toxin of MazEF toxin-antitoxin module
VTHHTTTGNVTLPADETGLGRASVVLVCQVMALDRSFFDELVTSLTTSARRKVDAGLRLALGLGWSSVARAAQVSVLLRQGTL